MKINFKWLLCLLCVLMFGIWNVDAAVNYGSLDSRIAQNRTIINSSNSMSSVDRARYSDVSLKDLPETNYKGLSSKQINVINNFANMILGNNNMNDYDKIFRFYDWIVNNYYYYEYPSTLSTLKNYGDVCDNPYYLIMYEYNQTGQIRARSNGYASMLVALSRSQGIPARTVSGYYNDVNYVNWSNVNYGVINHTFVEVYLNGNWVVLDPSADCFNNYDYSADRYITSESNSNYRYFSPSIESLSNTHIMFKHYPGSRSVSYITNTYEKGMLIKFLNKTSNKKSNGKRINYYYNKNNSSTWFTSSTSSLGDGYGRVSQIIWPKDRSLVGTLDLSGFSSLEKVWVPNNKISSLKIVNSPLVNTVSVAYNSISSLQVTGSNNIKLISAYGNPISYAKYNFGLNKKTAVVRANTGGTISIRYERVNGKDQHKMYAKAKSGYVFKGWYNGSKRISTKKNITVYRNSSFTYVAKFQKKDTKTYILISIKKQKLWYYKKGKLKMSANIVTGHKGKYDTPKGTYKIRSKARSVYLVGPDYRTFVNYWMLIDYRTQIGLHDASWRWNFGGSIYKWNGSHGCVNMPYSKAKYIYNNVPVGTKVRVK